MYEKLYKLAAIAFITTIISMIGVLVVDMDLIPTIKDEGFCSEKYPSLIEDVNPLLGYDWASREGIEKGYVKCCRKYYFNHTMEDQCKIFKDYQGDSK